MRQSDSAGYRAHKNHNKTNNIHTLYWHKNKEQNWFLTIQNIRCIKVDDKNTRKKVRNSNAHATFGDIVNGESVLIVNTIRFYVSIKHFTALSIHGFSRSPHFKLKIF